MENQHRVIALGFFDGVHLGHRALLDACRALARQTGARAGAVTFRTHPETLTAAQAPGLINSLEDRLWLLKACGAEQVVTLAFDGQLRTMPWRDFLDMLRRDWNARGFVCGEDFRFGYRGSGTAGALEGYCREEGLPFRQVEDQLLDGRRVSSSYIRQLLEQGRLEEAGRFLGHGHVLRGRLCRVDGRLGLALPEGLVKLAEGSYEGRALIRGKDMPARVHVDGAGLWLAAADEAARGLEGREIILELKRRWSETR